MADFNADAFAVGADLAPSFGANDPKPAIEIVLGPAVAAPDVTPPVVGGFSPALGSNLPTMQPITFLVTDDSGTFRRVIVHARFADGLEEVVHNGEDFRGLYKTTSSRVIAAGGFSYTILRSGGWVQGGPVAINVFAIDAAGNEAA